MPSKRTRKLLNQVIDEFTWILNIHEENEVLDEDEFGSVVNCASCAEEEQSAKLHYRHEGKKIFIYSVWDRFKKQKECSNEDSWKVDEIE